MTYSKTEIYETPLITETGVSTESGFAGSVDGYSYKGGGQYDMEEWNDNGKL